MSQRTSEARAKMTAAMSETASNKRRARLAQIALEAYFGGRTELRKGGGTASALDWSESDIVDLITDLVILAGQKGYDVAALLKTVDVHTEAETGSKPRIGRADSDA